MQSSATKDCEFKVTHIETISGGTQNDLGDTDVGNERRLEMSRRTRPQTECSDDGGKIKCLRIAIPPIGSRRSGLDLRSLGRIDRDRKGGSSGSGLRLGLSSSNLYIATRSCALCAEVQTGPDPKLALSVVWQQSEI